MITTSRQTQLIYVQHVWCTLQQAPVSIPDGADLGAAPAGGYGAAPAQAARPGMGAGTAGMLGAGGGLLGGMMLGEAMEHQ